jgi:hypothetical protein
MSALDRGEGGCSQNPVLARDPYVRTNLNARAPPTDVHEAVQEPFIAFFHGSRDSVVSHRFRQRRRPARGLALGISNNPQLQAA